MKKIIASVASTSMVVALGLSLIAPVSAQTTDTSGLYGSSTTSTTDTSSTTNPGLPNTGAGGDAAMNFAILLSTGLLAVGGSVLLARKIAA